MELLNKLGIDWKLLIAQIVNFLILFLILKKFLYGPVLDILEKRQKRVEKSLKDAAKIDENLAAAKQDYEKEVLLGKKQASVIIENAKIEAEKQKKAKTAEAKSEVEKIIKEAKEEIRLERQDMMKGLKSELSDLVLLASKKLTSQTLDKKTHQKLIDEAISDLQKENI